VTEMCPPYRGNSIFCGTCASRARQTSENLLPRGPLNRPSSDAPHPKGETIGKLARSHSVQHSESTWSEAHIHQAKEALWVSKGYSEGTSSAWAQL
jgi:hypothetical protein